MPEFRARMPQKVLKLNRRVKQAGEAEASPVVSHYLAASEVSFGLPAFLGASFHLGDLHRGHSRGSVSMRGCQVWPQRKHFFISSSLSARLKVPGTCQLSNYLRLRPKTLLGRSVQK